MKKRKALIAFLLLISLFIYLFYRTEKTLVNRLFILLFSEDTFYALSDFFSVNLSLNSFIIYSLPEGLWVFCATLVSKNLFLSFKKFSINCVYFPLIYSLCLEFIQFLNLTKGTYDPYDLLSSSLGWLVASYVISNKQPLQHLIKPFNTRSMVCVSAYLFVFFALAY